jgi:superoxide dismutase
MTYALPRLAYLEAWWNDVAWSRVAERYQAATGGRDGGS